MPKRARGGPIADPDAAATKTPPPSIEDGGAEIAERDAA